MTTETKEDAAVREASRALIAIGLLDGHDKERRLAAGLDRVEAAVEARTRARLAASKPQDESADGGTGPAWLGPRPAESAEPSNLCQRTQVCILLRDHDGECQWAPGSEPAPTVEDYREAIRNAAPGAEELRKSIAAIPAPDMDRPLRAQERDEATDQSEHDMTKHEEQTTDAAPPATKETP